MQCTVLSVALCACLNIFRSSKLEDSGVCEIILKNWFVILVAEFLSFWDTFVISYLSTVASHFSWEILKQYCSAARFSHPSAPLKNCFTDSIPELNPKFSGSNLIFPVDLNSFHFQWRRIQGRGPGALISRSGSGTDFNPSGPTPNPSKLSEAHFTSQYLTRDNHLLQSKNFWLVIFNAKLRKQSRGKSVNLRVIFCVDLDLRVDYEIIFFFSSFTFLYFLFF